MAFVIIDACSQEKAAKCLDVCPADCIKLADTQYVINPNLCIDCGACEVVCPVEAIYHEDELLAEDKHSHLLAINHFR
ncbi:4Fe-4S ferredoxin [Psychrobacillus glaciei]|uniref:Ferredoxin n=1 Tax=Psychrobacillus glaciei TaxID=2283160 RepID=A0A5J6SMU0_9BACI|nr:4Fe-4S binding protein [Psychrobacillus glaciei]QFF99236.1 4Fe-4S ferredoxin [Psychrobacillus glaciei]